jgi:hypothetical protein
VYFSDLVCKDEDDKCSRRGGVGRQAKEATIEMPSEACKKIVREVSVFKELKYVGCYGYSNKVEK